MSTDRGAVLRRLRGRVGNVLNRDDSSRRPRGSRVTSTDSGRDPRSPVTLHEPLSPELVLVSPDLFERACASLAHRPWDGSPLVVEPRASSSLASRRRALLNLAAGAVSVAMLVAFVTILAVGSVRSSPDEPTLEPTLRSSAHSANGRAHAQAPFRERRQASVPASVSVRPARARPRLRFHIDAKRHLIARVEGVLACAGRVTLVDIPIERDGTFGVVHRFGDRSPVRIWLAGTVGSGNAVRGTVRSARFPCDTGTVPFTAKTTVT